VSEIKFANFYLPSNLFYSRPFKVKVVLKAGSNSSDSHVLDLDEGSLASDDDLAQPVLVSGLKTQSLNSEDDDMPMLVDSSHEARFQLNSSETSFDQSA
jgi:hypothetical protein